MNGTKSCGALTDTRLVRPACLRASATTRPLFRSSLMILGSFVIQYGPQLPLQGLEHRGGAINFQTETPTKFVSNIVTMRDGGSRCCAKSERPRRSLPTAGCYLGDSKFRHGYLSALKKKLEDIGTRTRTESFQKGPGKSGSLVTPRSAGVISSLVPRIVGCRAIRQD
jgi:hypothetical protein